VRARRRGAPSLGGHSDRARHACPLGDRLRRGRDRSVDGGARSRGQARDRDAHRRRALGRRERSRRACRERDGTRPRLGGPGDGGRGDAARAAGRPHRLRRYRLRLDRAGARAAAAPRTAARSPSPVRIAAGQGFWGDWLEAPYRQVTGGPIDYLMMDYLAEVTMSILQKQKSRDPSLGYAKDFVPLMERILPIVVERGIKVTANAGGVNPRACAQAVADVARRLKLGGRLRIGVVTGDDLLGRLDGL